MQTQLIFFDSQYNSSLGTKRSLIALPFISALFLIFNIGYYRSFWKYILPIFLTISALGVQLPQSKTEATIYGALVGFVIFGTIGSLYADDFVEFLKDIALGIGFCSITSLIICISSKYL